MLTVRGANQTGSKILVAGDPVGDYTDYLVIDGVQVLNPVTQERTGCTTWYSLIRPMQAAGDGLYIMEIHPPIICEGPYRNATNPPLDGALVRFPFLEYEEKMKARETATA